MSERGHCILVCQLDFNRSEFIYICHQVLIRNSMFGCTTVDDGIYFRIVFDQIHKRTDSSEKKRLVVTAGQKCIIVIVICR